MGAGWPALVTALTALCWSRETSGANILAFYPYPARSHHLVYWPLLRELVARGHNVTMLSALTMPDAPAHNYTELKIKNYSEELQQLEDTGFMMSSNFIIRFVQNSMFFMRMGKYLTERLLQDSVFKTLLQSNSEFDLIFSEWTFSLETFSALHHRFGAVNVELTSFGNFHWTYWVYGQPFDTSYIADSDTSYSDTMCFTERLQNTLQSLGIRLMWYWYYMPQYQALMDRHIRYPGWQSRGNIMDLLSNTSLVLMNTHYSLNYPYPNSPHFKEIGGINIQPLKPLPQEIAEFMDEAKDGVIYFSLGSFLHGSSVLDHKVQKAFLHAFSKLKQRVIWKMEKSVHELPKNVMIGSWLPQQSILAHKNCKLFISHAGFLSLTEAVNEAVPVVAIPIWADQLRNARQMTTTGYAVELHFTNLTEESISWAVAEVLHNPKYKQKALEQSRIFRDKPESALDTAVFWTEYVLRHRGAHHLKPATARMPWYQQAMLDVYFALFLIVFLPLYIILKTVRAMMSCICRNKSKTVSTKRKIQ